MAVVGTFATDIRQVLCIVAAVALFALPAGSAAQEAQMFEGHTLAYWIERLETGSDLEKRDAMIAVTIFGPQDAHVVRLLIDILENRRSYQLQTLATNALGAIGPFAQESIPALIGALSAPDIEDDSVREQAASALFQVAESAPDELIAALETAVGEPEIVGLLRAIGYLRPSSARAVTAVLDALEKAIDSTDVVTSRAVFALNRIGEAAVPQILERLRTTQSAETKKGLIDAVGEVYFYVDEPTSPPEDVTDALVGLTSDSDVEIQRRALIAISYSTLRNDKVRERLAEILDDLTSDPAVAAASASAGAKLFPEDTALAALVVAWFAPDTPYRSDFVEALGAFGTTGTDTVLSAMERMGSDGELIAALDVLDGPAPPTSQGVDAALKLVAHPNPEVAEAAVTALGQMPPQAFVAVPALTIVAQGSSPARIAALESLAALAEYGLTDLDLDVPALAPLAGDFARAAALAAPMAVEFGQSSIDNLSAFASRLQEATTFRNTVLAATVLAIVLGVTAALIVSWRLRQWLLVLAGRRWFFTTRMCDRVVRVVEEGTVVRVSVDMPARPQAAKFEERLARRSVSRKTKARSAAREAIGRSNLVRVEVERPLFGLPWGRLLAGSWDDPESGNVAGQVCLVQQAPELQHPVVRRVAYRGLSTAYDCKTLPSLPMAGAEVDALAARFSRWGAEVQTTKDAATRADFLAALRDADIIHVAAHASFDRIHFADGDLTTEDLAGIEPSSWRCSLLVLSACRAGDIRQPAALLWSLVLRGINVIAAREAVHDYVCFMFFDELVAALLPTRKANGVILADAIRAATRESRKRLSSVPQVMRNKPGDELENSLSSFALFGDPTLRLVLSRPEK